MKITIWVSCCFLLVLASSVAIQRGPKAMTDQTAEGIEKLHRDALVWDCHNDLGRKVIAEMNALGMVIDLSHVSAKTFFDVIETTRDPVIFSHSGCRAINPHRRNVSDDMLRALAKNGGVIESEKSALIATS